MKLEDLRNDPIVIEWLDSFDRKNTTEGYLQGLRQFTDFTGKTPEELITEAEEEIKSGLLMRRRSIKKYLISFKKYLHDRNAAEYTIKNRLGGVRSFYSFFDIEIPRMKRESNRPHTKVENLRIPTKEEIQDILKVCEPLEKAIVLAGISSGLSAAELCNLKISDFKNGYDPETGITTLHIRRTKTRVDFITFFSPEASKAILEYLDYRNREPKTRKTEKMIALRKQRVKEDGYLFIKQLIPPEYDFDQNEEIRKITGELINQIYRSVVEKAGKNAGLNKWNYIRSHTMRKYFNSALLNAGADSFFVEFTMGHMLNQTQEAYFQAQPNKLKEIYKKYIPFLTIQESLDITKSPEFKRMINENEVLRAERQELQELRAKVEAIEKDKQQIIKNIQSMSGHFP